MPFKKIISDGFSAALAAGMPDQITKDAYLELDQPPSHVIALGKAAGVEVGVEPALEGLVRGVVFDAIGQGVGLVGQDVQFGQLGDDGLLLRGRRELRSREQRGEQLRAMTCLVHLAADLEEGGRVPADDAGPV